MSHTPSIDGAGCSESCEPCAVEDARQRSELRAEVERLREALTQVLIDINDPHPRMGTLEGFRGAMENTEKMVRRVLDGGEP